MWNLKISKVTMTMKPFGSQLDKSIGIVDFSLLSLERLLIALENGSYAILNDGGEVMAKAKVSAGHPG